MSVDLGDEVAGIHGGPLVSVLIPVFNAERYLIEAFDSILHQTYANLEIIAVDDGSQDSSFSRLQCLAVEDARIKVFQNAKNCGIVGTLNRALALASGAFIARMDADDIAMPERIERQLEFLLRNPDMKLVGVANVAISPEGEVLSASSTPTQLPLVERTLFWANPVSHNWLCHRSIYTELGGYRELAPVEDYDFLLRCKSRGFNFTNLPYCGMKIRLTEDGITAVSGIRQKLAFNYVIKLYKQRRRGSEADSYSPESYAKAIKSGPVQGRLYAFANTLIMKAIRVRSRSLIWAGGLIAVSMLVSPLQFQYICRRLLLRWFLSRESST